MSEENKAIVEQVKEATQLVVKAAVDEMNTKHEGEIKALSSKFETELKEQKNLVADLEAKGAFTAPVVEESEVKFDDNLLNQKLHDVFMSCKDGNREFDKIDTKGLAIGGTGGESLAIDQELGRRIIERARENVVILGLVGSKTVSSTDYREMVLRGYPSTAKGTERVPGSNQWTETGTQTYEQVVMKVGKQYAKPFISDEAISDPHIDLMAHLEVLLAEEMSRYWALQVLFGDGSTDNLRGMLSSNRIDAVESLKTSDERDFDYYPIVKSSSAALIGADDKAIMDNLIDMTVQLPTQYLNGSSYTMNRRTLGRLRKLRDTQERPLIQFERGGFSILGFGINVEDYWPGEAADATPIGFGQLSKAYTLINIDDKFLLDPYSQDGGVVIKATSRKGEMVMHNDAVVFLRCMA
ncbi:coil containing protein [Vibrio phage 3.058.O._10N.286.46.B8]|nr:coil containing protein [Vibrio phage 2.058.O._10N.286.46.B8]AUS03076.1 coil containing protein [Vibrio phage 3.058.O._10N.286.46.B8]